MKKVIVTLALALSGCAGAQASYVKADNDTYEIMHRYIPRWIDSDASIDSDTKSDLHNLEYSWGVRVKAGIASVSSR